MLSNLLSPHFSSLSVCQLCYLRNHWMKSSQIWCVIYSHKLGMQQHFFYPTLYGPREGSIGQISHHFTKSISTIFIPNSVIGFSFGHTPGEGLGGTWGSKNYFFQTWSCGISYWYQILGRVGTDIFFNYFSFQNA